MREYKMKYTTVLFDLDGTLVNTSQGIYNSICHTLLKMFHPLLEIDKLSKFVGPSLHESFKNICNFNEDESTLAVETFRRHYSQQGVKECTLYEGIKTLLEELKRYNITIGIVTLKREDLAIKVIKVSKIEKFFSVIIGDEHTKGEKLTKYEGIEIAIDELNIEDRSKVVMIGDSLGDGKAAEESGIDFIPVTYGFGFKDELACLECNSIGIATKAIDILKVLIDNRRIGE